MKYKLILTGKFKKSLKLAKKRGLNISYMEKVVETLQQGLPLDEKYRDHELKGKFKGFRECHVQPVLLRLLRTLKFVIRNIQLRYLTK